MEEKDIKQSGETKQAKDPKVTKQKIKSEEVKETQAKETVEEEQPVNIDPWGRLLFGDRRVKHKDIDNDNKGFSWI